MSLVVFVGCDGSSDPSDGGAADARVACERDVDCDDGLFCTGVERCDDGLCAAGAPACLASQTCDETTDACASDCATAPDADGDGVASIECGGSDCDDSDVNRFPGNPEVCDAEGHDEDCDDTTLAGPEGDVDGDGVVSSTCCASIDGALRCGGDCADDRPGVSPDAAEVCNGIDDDCNGLLDHPAEDNDGDGHADVLCAGALASDCDDTDPRVYFDAPEICDGRDSDCIRDGARSLIASAEPGEDDDGDGHAALDSTCIEDPAGLPKDDCDDTRALTYPGAEERCNGIDDDCDGVIDDVEGSALAGTACVPSAIAAGTAHTCALRPDGTVLCWGGNTSGELGDTGAALDEAVLVPGIDDAQRIEAAYGTTCAQHADGSLTCWGWDGLLGARTFPSFQAQGGGFGRVPHFASVSDVSLGYRHACAIVDGAVVCWGQNCQGVLDGTEGDCTSGVSQGPTEIVGVDDPTQVDAGGLMNCAVRATGRVSCWGPNYGGMLGDGSTTRGIVEVSAISDAVEVAVGFDHACARHADGHVSCWGNAGDGRLGCAGESGCLTSGTATTPVRVAGLSDAVRLESGGGNHTCALRATGTLVCWGSNAYGQIGDDDWGGPGTTGGAHALAPTPVVDLTDVVDLSVGRDHTCATRVDGTYCWGRGDTRQLGDGRTDHVNGERYPGYLRTIRPVPVSAIVAPISIEVGFDSSCFIRHDGAVRCAGSNVWGHLGTTDITARSTPQPAYGREDLVDVHTSIHLGCRVAESGELECTSRYSGGPETSGPGSTDARQTAVGYESACVLRADATVSCYGRNTYGQLGADFMDSVSAALVPVVRLTDVAEIVGGDYHFCARTGEAVWCWGRGSEGQLGSVRVSRAPAPLRVTTLPGRPVDIDAYGHTSCAVIDDGRVFCWGEGLGPAAGSSSPEVVTGFAGEAEQVTVGGDHACLRTRGGAVYCWGAGANGRLGTGGTTSSATPVALPELRRAATVDCGNDLCCAVRTSGQPVCWGAGSDGLANGSNVTPRPDQPTPRMAVDIAR